MYTDFGKVADGDCDDFAVVFVDASTDDDEDDEDEDEDAATRRAEEPRARARSPTRAPFTAPIPARRTTRVITNPRVVPRDACVGHVARTGAHTAPKVAVTIELIHEASQSKCPGVPTVTRASRRHATALAPIARCDANDEIYMPRKRTGRSVSRVVRRA